MDTDDRDTGSAEAGVNKKTSFNESGGVGEAEKWVSFLTPSVHTSGSITAQLCLVALISEAAHIVLIEEEPGGGQNVIGNHSLITRMRDSIKTAMLFWTKTVAKGRGWTENFYYSEKKSYHFFK